MNKSIFLRANPSLSLANTGLWLRPIFTLGGALLYLFLFSSTKGVGINMLLFDIGILLGSRLLDRELWQNNFAWLSGFGLLVTSICVVLVHNTWARLIHIIYFLLFIGYIQRRELRFICFGLLLGLWSLATAAFSFIGRFSRQMVSPKWSWPNASRFWILLLPVIIIIPFYLLYGQANPAFAKFFQKLFNFFSFSFEIDPMSILYFNIGLVLCSAVFYPGCGQNRWLRIQKTFHFDLIRKRGSSGILGPVRNPILALKREYLIAIVSMFALNFLLFIANAADLRYLWFDFGEKSPAQLSQYVHAGTWSLISSIVLAMIVLLVFFRENLNFYPKSTFLRKLAYVWLAQNAWLALGVGLRNGFYIHYHGLAHGRIVVVVFLVLVLLGLWSLYIKIAQRKTLYFVVQTNAWAMMITLLITAAINWDVLISRYNIQISSKEGIDLYHLETLLSDQNTFLLIRHREQLYGAYSNEPIDHDFLIKKANLSHKLNKRNYENTWLAWNWPDARNKRALDAFEEVE